MRPWSVFDGRVDTSFSQNQGSTVGPAPSSSVLVFKFLKSLTNSDQDAINQKSDRLGSKPIISRGPSWYRINRPGLGKVPKPGTELGPVNLENTAVHGSMTETKLNSRHVNSRSA